MDASSSSLLPGAKDERSAITCFTWSPVTCSMRWKPCTPMSATTQLGPDFLGFIFHALRLSSGLEKSILRNDPCWYSRTTLSILPSSPEATMSRASLTIGKPE